MKKEAYSAHSKGNTQKQRRRELLSFRALPKRPPLQGQQAKAEDHTPERWEQEVHLVSAQSPRVLYFSMHARQIWGFLFCIALVFQLQPKGR